MAVAPRAAASWNALPRLEYNSRRGGVRFRERRPRRAEHRPPPTSHRIGSHEQVRGSQLSVPCRPLYSPAGEATCRAIGRRADGGRHRVYSPGPRRLAAAALGVEDVLRLLRRQDDEAVAEADPPDHRGAGRGPRQGRANRVPLRHSFRGYRQELLPRHRAAVGAIGTRARPVAAHGGQGGRSAGRQQGVGRDADGDQGRVGRAKGARRRGWSRATTAISPAPRRGGTSWPPGGDAALPGQPARTPRTASGTMPCGSRPSGFAIRSRSPSRSMARRWTRSSRPSSGCKRCWATSTTATCGWSTSTPMRRPNVGGRSRCFGPGGRFARLEAGINYLRQERRCHRQQVFQEMVDYWQQLRRQGFWDNLSALLDRPRRCAAALRRGGVTARRRRCRAARR